MKKFILVLCFCLIPQVGLACYDVPDNLTEAQRKRHCSEAIILSDQLFLDRLDALGMDTSVAQVRTRAELEALTIDNLISIWAQLEVGLIVDEGWNVP